MDFQVGERYERPSTAGPSWAYQALGDVRRQRVGGVPVRLEYLDGGEEDGLLEGVSESPTESHGVVDLEGREVVIEANQIVAFTLLPGPPVDRSDR